MAEDLIRWAPFSAIDRIDRLRTPFTFYGLLWSWSLSCSYICLETCIHHGVGRDPVWMSFRGLIRSEWLSATSYVRILPTPGKHRVS